MWLKYAKNKSNNNEILFELYQNLIDEAESHEAFESFVKAYSLFGRHGNYSHITHASDFAPDPKKGPRDAQGVGSPEITEDELMVSTDVEQWLGYAGHNEDSVSDDARQYVVFLRVKPSHLKAPDRGNNEFNISEATQNASVIAVVPIQRALQIEEAYRAMIPQSEKELRKLWMKIKG